MERKWIFQNSVIYVLNDGKGFVKQYDFYGKLIFEGEYINGEKNGKGKEYENFDKYIHCQMKFEGEYLNGIKIKGKEYDDNNHLLFEGE